MKRIFIALAALSFLLPGLSVAQPVQIQPVRPGRPGSPPPGSLPPGSLPPGSPPPRPVPRPVPAPQRPPPPRPALGRPGYRPPVQIQPLPPRGNQFWHRGRYYGRIPGPAYVYPRGWGYRRWWVGARLPPVFLTPGYVFPGWATLGLQAPVPGYSWVRFGPDLLLVNLTTGEVEDVVYGAFL